MFVTFDYQPTLEDFTKDGKLELGAIMKILENTGNKHSDTVGDAILQGSNNGRGWILTEWMLEISEYPEYGDKITGKTWTQPVKQAFTCVRDFELYKNDKLCAKGTTRWVLLDLSTGRPIKIEQDIIDIYKPEDVSVFTEGKLPRILPPAEYTQTLTIQQRRRDIDFNHHVHNLTYLDYAMEVLPEEIYENRCFKHLRITFKFAIKAGEKINCQYGTNNDKHVINIAGENGEQKALIELC